jgi:hypothetical protein
MHVSSSSFFRVLGLRGKPQFPVVSGWGKWGPGQVLKWKKKKLGHKGPPGGEDLSKKHVSLAAKLRERAVAGDVEFTPVLYVCVSKCVEVNVCKCE